MKRVKEAVGYWCSDILEKGYLGKGIGIAVLDTGIFPHPDFGNRIVEFRDCTVHQNYIYDDSGHGTHVAGILSGSGKLSGGAYAGMAPEAHLVVGKVLDRMGNGTVEYIIEGIEWVLERRKKRNIYIVNISVGSQPGLKHSEEMRLLQYVERLWDAGLVVVASAGNYGPGRGTVAVPGNSRKVITAGAAKQKGKSYRDYSGRGPTDCCVIKPDLVAPGTMVTSCSRGYGGYFWRPYAVKSGTSMAAPVVSGAIACLLSKYPQMTNVEVKLKLRESCTPVDGEGQGWGMLNVKRLLTP